MACPAKRNPVLFVRLERRMLTVVLFLPSCIISSCLFPIFTLQVLLGFIVRSPDSFSPGSNLGPLMILLLCRKSPVFFHCYPHYFISLL